MKARMGIVSKMVIGITLVSSMTYATSAFFLLELKGWFDFLPSWLFVLLTLAFGVFWTGLFGFFATRWLLKPLLALTKAAREAEQGNLRVRLDINDRRDELSQLAAAFQGMLNRLGSITEGITDNSRQADMHVGQLQEAIDEATIQIEEMAHHAESISEGTVRQFASAEAMRQSVGKLSDSALAADREAAVARERTSGMNRSVQHSEAVFGSMVTGMHKLAELNREALEVVERLNGHAEKIGSISNVVGDFAEQTHLLALNASIEAARAGEEGRGFEVVAQAVKTLAGQSASAVKTIRSLISQIQQETARCAAHMRTQTEVAEREAEQGQASADSLSIVAADAAEVGALVQAISLRLSEQADQVSGALLEAGKMAEVAGAIRAGAEQVSSASQEQTAFMQEIAASSEALRAKSLVLKEQSSFFKVANKD